MFAIKNINKFKIITILLAIVVWMLNTKIGKKWAQTIIFATMNTIKRTMSSCALPFKIISHKITAMTASRERNKTQKVASSWCVVHRLLFWFDCILIRIFVFAKRHENAKMFILESVISRFSCSWAKKKTDHYILLFSFRKIFATKCLSRYVFSTEPKSAHKPKIICKRMSKKKWKWTAKKNYSTSTIGNRRVNKWMFSFASNAGPRVHVFIYKERETQYMWYDRIGAGFMFVLSIGMK